MIRSHIGIRSAHHAESIADLALEVCEERLAETRRRKPMKALNLSANNNNMNNNTDETEAETGNPFLSRLGSPFGISRSMQPCSGQYHHQHQHQHQRRNQNNNNYNNNNIHPLKMPKQCTIPKATAAAATAAKQESTIFQKLHNRLSVLDAPSYTLLLLFLTLIILPKGIAVLQDRLFEWHRLEHRKLQGRHCVLNLFIHQHKPDEFNPDLNIKDPAILTETYRTKGQIKVISRLIGCVADSFRNNLNVAQHVVFAGVRDGGHLAQEALLHWPQRGTHRTTLHVFADDAYENLADMEDRFTGFNQYIHLYDHVGNMAGTLESEPEDDDGLPEQEKNIPETNLEESDFETLLWAEQQDVKDVKSIIPYFHIDGSSMTSQLNVLHKAKSLFGSHSIAVVGLEHSPDMDIHQLVEFFTSVNYKTFMLGLRQLSRIDNLCPEILNNILDHPYFHNDQDDWLSVVHGEQQNKPRTTPPFFVAMPKSRHQLEEMTIQHMYDLFSGEGGGGQVKTANDRKAPTKK